MKLLYVNNVDIDGDFARSKQVRSNIEAFNLILKGKFSFKVISKHNNRFIRSLNESSNIRKIFIILSSTISIFKHQIIYSRNLYVLYYSNFFNKTLVWEMHDIPSNNYLFNKLEKKINIVCISSALKNWLIKNGFKGKIKVAHDGVSTVEFNSYNCKTSYNSSIKKVVHTGSPYKGRGIEILISLAKNNNNIEFIHVGGKQTDIDYWKKQTINFKNLVFINNQNWDTLRYFQEKADVLLLPMTKKNSIWWCTSPMKLFEYMSSGSLIIHTGIGSINEILNEDNSFKLDTNNLDLSFNYLNTNFSEISLRAIKAREEVKSKYLWEIRATEILKFINEI